MKHRLRDRSQKQEKKQIPQNDPYKLSIHTSSNFNKSDSGSKRLNISRMLQNSRKKISMRKASELFQSGGLRPQSTKNLKRNQVIEFDNIKWISIISAYDPSRLKNVSVSKKSCQKFLSSNQQNIKTDSRNLLYFNDLIKNFKSWHNKIQMQYCYIMNKFLRQRQSANITLVQLRPKLDQVINQTLRMQQNLEDCLKSYENHEFRQLLEKYYTSLVQCQKIEKIILTVDKSKNKIVNLYKKFDDDRKIEQKITKVKNQGINEVKYIVSDYEVQIQTKIMDRIQDAINQIAQKSGQAYRKIKGVKHLIEKFKNTQHQSQQMNKIDIEAINFMGKVCKQICYQAQAFEQFSTRFLLDGGIINQDLQKIIKKYEQQVLIQRKRAIDLQMKFLNIIFSETIKKLKENSKIASVYENADAHNQEYRKILRMIQDIADCIIYQDKRISLQRLIKQTRTILDRLYDDLKYLKQKKKFQEIDTEEGLISILEVSKLIKEYKDKILLVRKKFQSSHRQVQLSPIKVEPITNDQETQFIAQVIGLSKKINNSGLKGKLQKQACFSSINEGIGLLQMSKQIQKQNVLEEITSISNQFLQLQNKNILEKYFGPLKLQNLIFKESIIMVQLKIVASKTKQKNIIPQLTQLLSKRNQWLDKHKKISPQMKRYFERILAFTLVKGLKSEDIKQIENPQNITFPTKQSQIQSLRSKAKYRQVLFDLIQGSVIQTTKSIITENTDQKGEQKTKNRRVLKSAKTKYNFYISDVLQKNILMINNFVSSFIKISDIKKNINSESYLAKQYFFEFSQKLFTEVFLKKIDKIEGTSTNKGIKNLLNEFIEISYDRYLCLTRKIIDEENLWKDNQKKTKSESQLNLNKIPIYLQKVIEVLQFYKAKTQEIYEMAKQAFDILEKSVENVENSDEEVNEYIRLSVYAKVISGLVKYSKGTDQKVHVILDNNKSPIALIDPKENVLKQVFPGLKKGKQLTVKQIEKLLLHEAKIGIELKTKKTKIQEKKETLTKQKSKPKKKQQDMQEQILDQQQVHIKDDMEEQYPADEDIEQIEDNNDDIPDDDMTEQLGQEFQQQQPQEQMVEDFQAPQDEIEQQKVQQEQALEDLIEESQNLGKSKSKKINTKNDIDQFDQYEWEQENDKSKKKANMKKDDSKLKQQKIKQKQQQQKKQKELEQKQKQQQQKKMKQQNQELQKQKRMKKQHIVFSQTEPPKKILQNTVYEVLSFLNSLYQLKKLIIYVSSFEQNYFKNFIDWKKIQHYYNDHSLLDSQIDKKQIQKYVKNLENDIEIKLKNEFKLEPTVFNEVKNLDSIKKIKKHLLLLKNGNWEALQSILSQNHVSYNILKSSNSALYVWIKQSSQDFDEFGSVHGYFSKSFKYYERSQFDLKGFTEKCCTSKLHQFKQHSFISVSYQVKNETSLTGKFVQIQQNYEKLLQFINDFSNGAKDIVNKFDFCLELYKKALQIKQKVNLDLNWYAQRIKFLQKYGADEFYPLSYMNFIKENIKAVIKKVKSLQSKLYNLSFKCEKNNLFECFDELSQLYGQEIEKKVIFSKGQFKMIGFLFDKTTIKENEEKIKRILSSQAKSKQDEAQKVLLRLFFYQQFQQTTEITQNQILKNAQKINFKSSQLLLEIIQTLRIDHSYILIKRKNLEFFNLKKSKQECISDFLSKVAKSIMQNKEASNILSGANIFASLKQLSNPKQLSTYQKLLSQQSLQKLFKQEVKSEKLYVQTKITVIEQFFILDKIWLQQSIKFMKEIVQCLNGNKNQINKILGNLKKLKPCHHIYYKRFAKDKQTQVFKLWGQHLSNFQKMIINTKSVMNKKSWILLLSSVSQNFNNNFVNELNNNIQTIKTLLQTQKIQNTFQAISKQVKIIFDWLVQKDKQQGKVQFSIIILPKLKDIIYFQCNLSGFNDEYFIENFAFIESINLELKEFLSNQIISNMVLDKNEEIRTTYKLKKTDKIYEIQTEKLSQSILNFITSILGQQSQQKRNKTAKDIVRVFNKIYYLSKTTQELNFKQQSQSLQNLKKDFKGQLEKLRLIYSFKTFLSSFNKTLWKGSKTVQNILQVLDKSLKDNEKIPQQQIQQILTKLEKIKVNNKTNSIDSYKPFYSWFYQTIMSIMKLPFYNIITHTSNQVETQFLGVIVTEKATKPGQQNEQLEKLLREIFLYTQHKPIYLKQNDLTVELLKQPAFVTLDPVVNGIQLGEIIDYLNENCQQEQKQSQQKVLHLRVDEIHKLKQDENEERTLVKIIPLLDFVKESQQEFNIHVKQEQLTVEIQFNVIYAAKDLTSNSKNIKKQYIPLNGTQVDSFEKVYMGKKLKLQKIKSWLYSFYLKRKNQIQVQNKDKMIEEFFNGFVQYFISTVTKQSRESVKKIFSKIELKSVLQNKDKPNKNEKLYLESSQQLLEVCKKQLQKFKTQEYETKPSLQKHYDQNILKLIENFERRLYEQLIDTENEIKMKMVNKIKTLACEKVKQIYNFFKQKKEKEQLQKAAKKQRKQLKKKEEQAKGILLQETQQPEPQKLQQKIEKNSLRSELSSDSDKDQNKLQKETQVLKKLKESNFQQYLMKKILLFFNLLTEDRVKNIQNEIFEKFDKKMKQIEQNKEQKVFENMKKKVYEIFDSKSILDGIDIKPHQILLFLYFMVQKNQPCYIQLFISQK